MTQQELKRLKLSATDDGWIRDESGEVAELRPGFRGSALLAAAPPLALACLEALRYIAHPLANDNKTHAHALKTLRAALGTAGVEVPEP